MQKKHAGSGAIKLLPPEILLRILHCSAEISVQTLLSLSSTTPRFRELYTVDSTHLLCTAITSTISSFLLPSLSLLQFLRLAATDKVTEVKEGYYPHDIEENIELFTTGLSDKMESSINRPFEWVDLEDLKNAYIVHRIVDCAIMEANLSSTAPEQTSVIPYTASLYARLIGAFAEGMGHHIDHVIAWTVRDAVSEWVCRMAGLNFSGEGGVLGLWKGLEIEEQANSLRIITLKLERFGVNVAVEVLDNADAVRMWVWRYPIWI